eukprot:3048425-Prymnesium_polylepis.2
MMHSSALWTATTAGRWTLARLRVLSCPCRCAQWVANADCPLSPPPPPLGPGPARTHSVSPGTKTVNNMSPSVTEETDCPLLSP